ncbi:methylenetetrahydrofolate reductase [Dellaglioa sp. P0083]|uniref:methylenetetrahydrofolate reductase n=1 Tax=Dellaglioa kimchii TaxID=3344667 RepID=UPI0038D383E1
MNFIEKVKMTKTVLVEWNTPNTLNLDNFFEGASALMKLDIAALSIADNPLGIPRVSNALMGYKLSEQQIPVILHLTTRDYNLVGLESKLMGLSAVGLNNLMIIKGDPTKIQDATNVYDLTSKQLITTIKKMNQGISPSNRELNSKLQFKVGGAFNINAVNLDLEFEDINRKIRSGVDYIITQPVFDMINVKRLKDWITINEVAIPIFISVMPILSFERAQFIQDNVQGIKLPNEFMAVLKQAALQNEERKVGIAASQNLIESLSKVFNGVHIVTPGSDYQAIIEIMQGQ